MPSHLSVFTDGFLVPRQVSLGRLVLDVKDLGKNFYPLNDQPISEGEVAAKEFNGVHQLLGSSSDSQITTTLTKFLSIFASRLKKSNDELSTEKATTYQLLNSDNWFLKLCQSDEAKKWLERYMTRVPIFMVVGLHTVENAAITLDHEQRTNIKGKVEAPLQESIAPGSSSVPGGDTLNLKAEGSKTTITTNAATFIAPKDRIVAVQYRKVEFGLLGEKMVEDARLAFKTFWKQFDTTRGAASDDIVASLQVETSRNDLKKAMEAWYTSPEKEDFVFLKT
jgi:hypothetical protein